MIESKTKTVGEHTYEYRPLTATPALKLFTKLAKTVGPAFAALASAGNNTDETGRALASAASALSDKLSEDDAVEILKTLAKQSIVDGKELSTVFEIHFMDIKKVFAFLMFAIEAQYGNFLGGSPDAVRRAFGANQKTPATVSTTMTS